MRRCVGTVRTHRVMWALIFSLLPSHVHSFISAASLDCKRPGPTLRVLLRETGSTPNMRHAPYKWLAGVSFSDFSGYGFCNGGP
jgi:hypothetical protein